MGVMRHYGVWVWVVCRGRGGVASGGGGTGSRKGYRLRSDCCGAVVVATPDWLKKGGCPLIILYDRGAVRVFSTNILHQITSLCIQICS